MWNFIPQLFYDFIARIVPGAIIIVISTFVFFGTTNVADFVSNPPENNKLFTMTPLLIAVLGSYLIGFIFGQLWLMTFARFTREKERQIEKECKEERLIEHNIFLKTMGCSELNIKLDELPQAFVMRSHLRHVMPLDVARLIKIRAERRLCQVLKLGFFVLGIVNFVYLLGQPTTERIVLEILFIIVIIACWSRALRQKRQLVNGTVVLWLMGASLGRIPGGQKNVENG